MVGQSFSPGTLFIEAILRSQKVQEIFLHREPEMSDEKLCP